MRRLPRMWWVGGSAVVIVAATLWVLVSPVVLDPLFNRFTPLRQEPLRGEVLRLVYTLTRSVEVEERAALEERLRTLLEAGVKPAGPFREVDLGGEVLRLAWVPPGVFWMGSPEDEEERDADEARHRDVNHELADAVA